MPKIPFVDQIQQHGTPQLAISNTATYGVGGLTPLSKSPDDSIGVTATITNIGNMDISASIYVVHENQITGQTKQQAILSANIPEGEFFAISTATLPPMQLDMTWDPGMWKTTIQVTEAGDITKPIAGGYAELVDAWELSIELVVSISNFMVY